MKDGWLEHLVLKTPVGEYVIKHFVAPVFSRCIDLPSEAVVLEMDCLSGYGARILAEEFNPPRIDSLCRGPKKLPNVDDQLPDYSGQVRSVDGELTSMQDPDAIYDAVFDFFTIHRISDWEAAISEASRVLKPGGFFAFAELYGKTVNAYCVRHMFSGDGKTQYSRPEWIRVLAENGLALMEGSRNLWGKGIVGVSRKGKPSSQ